MAIYNKLGLKTICIYIGINDDSISAATSNVLQNILNTVTQLEKIKKERDAHEDRRKKNPDLRLRPYPFLTEKIGKGK